MAHMKGIIGIMDTCKKCGKTNKPGTMICKCGAPLTEAGSQVKQAGFWLRTAAFAVDWMLMVWFLVLVNFIGKLDVFGLDAKAENIAFVETVIFLLYWILMDASKKQGSLGKMVMKLKVTNLDGSRISLITSLLRTFGKVISIIIGIVGILFIVVGVTPRKQGLHDMIAQTLVVRK